MRMMFPRFEAEMARRGMKKKAVATAIGISERSFHNKLRGNSRFTWDEACQIQARFFPDMSKDDLFNPSDRPGKTA